MRRSLGLLVVVLMPTLVVAQDIPVYHWQRDVELPEINSTTLVGVPLDSHFFLATRDGWPDVRLHDDRDQPVAFLIQAAPDLKTRTVRQTWLAKTLSAKVDATVGLQVELVLRDKEPLPQGVRIITPLRDFEHQVRIESSANGESWTSAGPPTVIFDYSRFVDARNDIVPFDAGNHRRFRLVIEDVTAEQESQLVALHRRLRGVNEIDRTESTTIAHRPFRIDRIEFYLDEEKAESSRPQTTKYSAANFVVTERKKDHQTILTFDAQREPITEIKVITETENFSRAATVEAEIEDGNGKLTWPTIANGTLTRFSVGTIQRQELTLTLRESHAAHYRVAIENRDSPPLSITGVELTGPLYELIFLASPDQKLTLEYGSSEAKAGRYDTAALQEALSQSQTLVHAKCTTPRENQNSPADRIRVWLPWNDIRVLLGGIVVLTLLLGWGLFRAGRRIGSAPV